MMQKYSSMRGRIQTGDIVLFSGKGGVSTGIKWVTGSKWSHVGMALTISEWDFVLLWESNNTQQHSGYRNRQSEEGGTIGAAQ